MSNAFYIIDNAGSMTSHQIPATPGLYLVSDPAGRGGINWRAPAAVAVSSSSASAPSSQSVSVSNGNSITQTITNITSQTIAALAPQVQAWQQQPTAILVKTGRVVTLQVTAFSVTLGATNFTSSSFLPLPALQTTLPISLIDDDSKRMGLLRLDTDGSLQIWPELMTNSGAWIGGDVVTIDGFVLTYILAQNA